MRPCGTHTGIGHLLTGSAVFLSRDKTQLVETRHRRHECPPALVRSANGISRDKAEVKLIMEVVENMGLERVFLW
jgi:hypothetical protein